MRTGFPKFSLPQPFYLEVNHSYIPAKGNIVTNFTGNLVVLRAYRPTWWRKVLKRIPFVKGFVRINQIKVKAL